MDCYENVIICEECGDTADCLRIYHPIDRQYYNICIDCEAGFRELIQDHYRDHCGLTRED